MRPNLFARCLHVTSYLPTGRKHPVQKGSRSAGSALQGMLELSKVMAVAYSNLMAALPGEATFQHDGPEGGPVNLQTPIISH